MIKNEIFSLLSTIDSESLMKDNLYIEQMIEAYEKSACMLEQALYDDLDTSSFYSFFKESAEDESNNKSSNNLFDKILDFLRMIPKLIESLINTIKTKLGKKSSGGSSSESKISLREESVPAESAKVINTIKESSPKEKKEISEVIEFISTNRINTKKKYGKEEKQIPSDSNIVLLMDYQKSFDSKLKIAWKNLKKLVGKFHESKFFSGFKLDFFPINIKIERGCKKRNLGKIDMSHAKINTILNLRNLYEFMNDMNGIITRTTLFSKTNNDYNTLISQISNWDMLTDMNFKKKTYIMASPTLSCYTINECWDYTNDSIKLLNSSIQSLNKFIVNCNKTIDFIIEKRRKIAGKTGINPVDNIKMRKAIHKLNNFSGLIVAYQSLIPYVCDALKSLRIAIKESLNVYNTACKVVSNESDFELISYIMDSQDADKEAIDNDTLDSIIKSSETED